MSTRKLVRPLLTGALGLALALALGGLSGCQAQSKPVPPPPGGITADRSLGDIMVRFRPPAVNDSVEAGKLLAEIQGPARFVVKRPMSGGVWLVTAISDNADATLEQALERLRAAPRVEVAEPDRLLKPNREMPKTREMPPD